MQRGAAFSIDKPMSVPPIRESPANRINCSPVLFAFSIVPLIMHSIALPAH